MGVDSEDVLSVALDSFADGIGSYQFEAYNFMSGDKPFASNTSVRWEIASLTSNGASITQDGLLTFTKPGEIVVKATSDENPEITATFTVRVNSVVSAVVGLQQGETTETVAFDSEFTADFTIMSDGKNSPIVTFHITSVLLFTDFPCDDDYTITVESGSATVNGDIVTLPMSGSVTLKLTFNAYPEVYRVFNFEVISKVFDYDPNAEFYRFGTVNEVPIRFVEGINLDNIVLDFEEYPIFTGNTDIEGNKVYESIATVTFADSKMSFEGGGFIDIIAKSTSGVELDRFTVEVINGAINITNDNQQFTSSKSYCLVEDIARTSGSISVAVGQYLYGNGYTITASKTSFSGQNSSFVSLSGTLDNVKIIGVEINDYYTATTGEENVDTYYKSAATVYIGTEGGSIYNSYIENGKYTVRLRQTRNDVTISNTAIVNGVFSLGITSIASKINVNLHNVQIAQLTCDDRVSENGNKFMGAALAFDQGGADNVTLNFSGDNNTLQNFATKTMISYLPSDYQTIANALWNELGNYKFNYNNETYVHIGLLAKLEKNSETGAFTKPTINFTGSNFDGKFSDFTKEMASMCGTLYAFDNTKAGVKTYVEGVKNDEGMVVQKGVIEDWLAKKPIHTFAYEPVKPVVNLVDSKNFTVTTDEPTANAEEFIYSNFSATKYGVSAVQANEGSALPFYYTVSVTKNGQPVTELSKLGLGEYLITYKLHDKFDGSSKEYVYESKVHVTQKMQFYIEIGLEPTGLDQGRIDKIDGDLKAENLAGVEYEKEVDKYSHDGLFGVDVNPHYVINVKGFFDVSFYYVDSYGVRNDVLLSDLDNVTAYCKETHQGENSYKQIAFDQDVEVGTENKPSTSSSISARYAKAYNIKIDATYNGIEAEIVLGLAFWVPTPSQAGGLYW